MQDGQAAIQFIRQRRAVPVHHNNRDFQIISGARLFSPLVIHRYGVPHNPFIIGVVKANDLVLFLVTVFHRRPLVAKLHVRVTLENRRALVAVLVVRILRPVRPLLNANVQRVQRPYQQRQPPISKSRRQLVLNPRNFYGCSPAHQLIPGNILDQIPPLLFVRALPKRRQPRFLFLSAVIAFLSRIVLRDFNARFRCNHARRQLHDVVRCRQHNPFHCIQLDAFRVRFLERL